jgi:hypothetical protein
MIAVIQDAAGRQPHAGHMKTRDGRRVLFVADPGQAPGEAGVCHARPDAPSGFCVSWRKLLLGYNANPRHNPLGLLPAYLLYPDEIYARLVEQLGPNQTYILSRRPGPVGSVVPDTELRHHVQPAAEPFRRREAADSYADLCMLPAGSDEDLYFFGDEAYIPLFCKLTAAHRGRRIVFYHSAAPPEAPGCVLREFASAHSTNWHHECAAAFLSTRPKPRSEQSASRVSRIESRLRVAMRTFPNASPALHGGGPELDDRAVRTAVRDARNQIEAYRWLVGQCAKRMLRTMLEFQERFDAFHRVAQRSRNGMPLV